MQMCVLRCRAKRYLTIRCAIRLRWRQPCQTHVSTNWARLMNAFFLEITLALKVCIGKHSMKRQCILMHLFAFYSLVFDLVMLCEFVTVLLNQSLFERFQASVRD